MFQQLDYLIGHFQRKALTLFGMVSIVPGPIGMFRKRALLSVGGYENDQATFAEDTELTFRLIGAGWKVRSENEMVAYTEVPNSYHDLLKQRYRWSRGVYQALMKNFDSLALSLHGRHVFFLTFLVWEQVLIPVIDFAFLVLFLFYFVFGQGERVYSVMLLYILAIDLIMSFLSTLGERKSLKWLVVSFLSRLTYVNLLLIWKIMAFYEEWSSVKMSWDKLKRRRLFEASQVEVVG